MRGSNSYHFVSRWRVEGGCAEVADVLGDPLALTGWWQSVYLDVQQLDPPDASGVGRRVRLLTRGRLPYTLRWESVVLESRYPHGFTIAASGDFEGRGVWTFRQDGRFVDITYDWRIRAQKMLLRRLSFLLKPIFEANHRWAMAQGETGLDLELRRRRATSAAARSAVPPPPPRVTDKGAALVGAALVVGGALAFLLVRARRR